MGIEHDRLRDQIQGALAGAETELERETMLLQEKKELVAKLERSRDELREILEHHDARTPVLEAEQNLRVARGVAS